jgi:hypothetical protein
MHLTNYSINRHSASFDTDERDDRGSKRTLSSFMAWLHKTGHNVVELWAKIHVSYITLPLMWKSHSVSLLLSPGYHCENSNSGLSSYTPLLYCLPPRPFAKWEKPVFRDSRIRRSS